MSIQGTALNQMMADLHALQASASGGSLSATAVTSSSPASDTPSFSDMLGQAINQVHQNQQVSSQLASAFEMGQSGVDLTEVMVASQKSTVSFEALTQVRNKLVQAYQDVMQMTV